MERPAKDIFNTLILSIFLAGGAALLLAVGLTEPSLQVILVSPAGQAFLMLASAALSFLNGFWLHQEVKQSGHRGVVLMTTGLWCLSLIHLAAAFQRDRSLLAFIIAFLSAWTTLFVLMSTCVTCVRGFRRKAEAVLGDGVHRFRYAGLGLFGIVSAAGLVGALNTAESQQAAFFRWVLYPVCLALVVSALFFVFRLYLRRRTQVILTFALALALFGLFLAAVMLSPVWSVTWWYGQALASMSLFLVGYGVLEGHRAREREMLITELGALSEKLEEQSVRDALTGCFNRRYAIAALEGEFQKSRRSGLPMALLIGDIDDFKRINDTHGHPMGDFVLQEVAARLRESLRGSDTLARCGGEEFWIILPFTNRVGGQEVAAKLLASLRDHTFDHRGVSMRVTMSIGIADTMISGVTSVSTLLHEADRALYTAKRAGKDRAMMQDPLAFTVPPQ